MSSVRSMMVTVGANVAPYVAGMRTAQTATGQFATSTAAARGGAGKLSGVLGGLSPKLLGPAGVVAGLKIAADAGREFNESTINLRTQIGLTEQQSANLADAARQVGTDFGVGGQAAIDASWQIASAGLRGEDATVALEAAARGAATGFGEMETLAGLSAAAVNAYGSEVIDAAEATDVVAAAVREGTAAPEEMAATLGRLLPLAAEMGIEFHEIAAGQAAMTRTGSDAAEASTQLRGILSSILNPAESSATAMEEFGLSAEGLREIIDEDGLFAALMSVRDAVGENDEAYGRIFPNIRALTGFLDLTGSNAEATGDVFDSLADSTGTVDRSFRDLADSSTQFQADRLKSNISDLALAFGTELDPAIRESMRLLNMMFDQPETSGGTALLGRDANFEPLSGIDRALRFVDPFRDLRTIGRNSAMGIVGDLFGDDGGEGQARHIEAMRSQADQYVDGLVATAQANDDAAESSRSASTAFDDMRAEMADAKSASEQLSDALEHYRDTVERATSPVFNLKTAVDDVKSAQDAYNDAVAKHGEESDEATDASWDLFDAVLGLESAAIDADLSFEDFENQLDRMVAQGHITAEEADVLRGTLGELVDQADEFDGERRAVFIASLDQARLDSVEARLDGAARDRAVRFIADQRTLADVNRRIIEQGGSVRLKASGGSVWPGQTAVVGEHGPELVTFSGHGRVIPANQTANMMSRSGSADRTFNVQQTFHGTDRTVLAEARHQQRLAFLEAV